MYNLEEVIKRLDIIADNMEEGEEQHDLRGEINNLEQILDMFQQLTQGR